MFKMKYDINDRIFRYKIRWIIHEYKQFYNVNYNEIWIEIIRNFLFKILFAIEIKRRMYIHQINIIIVFLYEWIDVNVYVTQFEKFIENFDLICYLLKTLYNLKQISKI